MRKMSLMSRNQQGSDAVTFQSFTEEVLDEKDKLAISELIHAFDKGQFDLPYYISRVAILSHNKKLRAAFDRHVTLIIRQVEKDHG
jgi:hypothetical protein